MNSHTAPGARAERHSGDGDASRTRLAGLVLLLAAQLLYLPINRAVVGGTRLVTPWDQFVPFCPAWAVPYLLSIPWWVGCCIWAARRMEEWRFRSFVAGMLATTLSAYLVYIVFPTYVERPSAEGTGWPVALVRLIHAYDRANNAFPSGHTYTTLLIVFFWWSWQPRLRAVWALIGVTIILSTLFTGQHHLLDPLGGAVWAWLGYRFGRWWGTRREHGCTGSDG